jgi:CRISPR/Cas system-associated exonuclease Cas4 (RecB family)
LKLLPKLKDVLPGSKVHWFESIIDEELEAKEKEREDDTPKGYFRVSSAHECPRALWYKLMGYPAKPPTKQGRRRMSIGTMYHDWIQSFMQQSKYFVKMEEHLLLDDPPLSGHFDGVILHPKQKEEQVAEFKSFDPESAKKYKTKFPVNTHVIQWNIYSYMLNIPKGFIMYVNKATQTFEIFDQIQDATILAPIFKKLRWVKSLIDKGERVPYQPDENHNWCPFKDKCESDFYIKGL